MLYLSDPKALHNILIKEVETYKEPDDFMETNMLVFGPGLVSTIGMQHKRQRKMLNPVFSVNHMRHLVPILYSVAHKLHVAISQRVRDGPQDLDILHWMSRYALEIVGHGGLGHSFDSFETDEQDPCGKAMKAITPAMQKLLVIAPLFPYVSKLGPAWLQRRILDVFPYHHIRTVKHCVDVMSNNANEVYSTKIAALNRGDETVAHQVGEGKDIMSTLIKANQNTSDKEKLSEDEVVAQISTIVFGGSDTSSNTLSRILELLANHPDIQSKLRDELLAVGAAEGIPYDQLNQLPYLDAVVRETLRRYPPLTLLSRVYVCALHTTAASDPMYMLISPKQDVVLPLYKPVRGVDGTMITELPLKKGTQIVLGIQGINNSEELWGENALDWNPQRWLSPLPKEILEARVPGVYSNIGVKFAELGIKVMLAVLLSHLTFAPTEDRIVWNLAGVWYPAVELDTDNPRLPLRVSPSKGGNI